MTGVQTCALPICFPVTIGGVSGGFGEGPAFAGIPAGSERGEDHEVDEDGRPGGEKKRGVGGGGVDRASEPVVTLYQSAPDQTVLDQRAGVDRDSRWWRV